MAEAARRYKTPREVRLIAGYHDGLRGGQVRNKNKSIARANKIYDQAVLRGRQILEGVGYKGF